jgi:antitoxin MazE
MRASISRWGNSLALRLPKEIAETAGLREGAAVELTIDNGAIVLRRKRYDIRELVASMDDSKMPPLLLEDEARGTEEW